MKTPFGLIALLLLLPSLVQAAPQPKGTPILNVGPNAARVNAYVTSDYNRHSGLIGLHLNRASSDLQAHGISLDLDGTPVWDTTAIDFEWPDLILAYSHTLQADNLRLRSDTAQMELGQRVGHPVTPFQFHITGGREDAPLGGIAIATYSYHNSLYMYNRQAGSRRTNINFANLFAWETDSTNTGTPDIFLHNWKDNTNPITVNSDNRIGLNGSLAHNGATAGFFGAEPVARPTVTGSRSDGTALASLMSALSSMGLINDNTTQ